MLDIIFLSRWCKLELITLKKWSDSDVQVVQMTGESASIFAEVL